MEDKLKEYESISDYVESLIEFAKDAEQRNTEEALTYALKALSLATEHDLQRQIARSHVRIGRCHWINGNFDEAFEHLGLALKLSDEIQEIYAKVSAMIGLGNVYITMQIMDQALTHYNNALSIAKDHGFGELVSKVLNNLGTLHEDLQNYGEALSYYQKSLEKTIEIDDDYGTAIANLNIGNIYYSLDKIDDAIHYTKTAIKYGKDHNKTLLLAHSYYSMGKIHQYKKEYKKSIQSFMDGVSKAKESKDLYILFRIELELANAYLASKAKEDAETCYFEALDIAKQIGMDELLLDVYEQLAMFYEKEELYEKAYEYYRKYHGSSKDMEENRRKERVNSIVFQEKLSASLEETKIYRQLSTELRKSYESMHVLSKIGQTMTSTHELSEIFEQLYDNVNLLMNAEGLGVGLYSEQENALVFDWFIENGKKLDSFQLSLTNEKSWTIWSFKNKQALKINDIEKEYKRYIKGIASTKGDLMHSAMYAPLMVEGEVIGVFSIQAKEKNAYTDTHKDLLKTLASYLAIAIKNARKTIELDKLNKMLKTKSEHDGLTGIPNRRLFDDMYHSLWTDSMKQKEPLSVMIVDIDNFKAFNDQYGHLIGDEVVKSVASLLMNHKGEMDFVARYGGDEFIALLPRSTKANALVYAGKLRESLLDVNKQLGIDTKVTVSIGIATAIANEDILKEKLIYTADNQLYLSKANGKDQTSITTID